MVNLNISDCGQMIKKAEKRYSEYCSAHGITDAKVIVNNSGGKDSGATDLLAKAILGDDGYRSVACDTGNEHSHTINHLKTWHEQRGVIRLILSVQIIHKSFLIKEKLKLKSSGNLK